MATKRITIDGSVFTGSLTRWPAILSPAATSNTTHRQWFRDAQVGGTLWFSSDEAGTTLTGYKHSEVWTTTDKCTIRLPIAATITATDLVIYAHDSGKPAGYDSQSPIIDDSNCVGYYDLANDGSDSSENAADGTGTSITFGGATGPDGHTPATNFASSARIDVSLASLPYPFSVQAWFKTSGTGSQCVASVANSGSASQQHRATLSAIDVRASSFDGTDRTAQFNGDFDTVWTLATWTWEAADDRRVRAGDGANATNTGSVSIAGIDRLTLGTTADSSPAIFFGGDAALVRVFKHSVSEDQTKADRLVEGPNASTYYTIEDVAVATFNPAWAIHSNTLVA